MVVVVGRGGCTSPVPGSSAAASAKKAGAQRGRGRWPLPFPSPRSGAATSFEGGSPVASAGGLGWAGYGWCFWSPVDVRSGRASLPARAAAAEPAVGLACFAQWAERRLREPSCCAALRCAQLLRLTARDPGGAALGGSSVSWAPWIPLSDWQYLAPKRRVKFPGFLRHPAPLSGGRQASIFLLWGREQARWGVASGRPNGEIPAVAMAPGTCCRGRPPGLGVQSIP